MKKTRICFLASNNLQNDPRVQKQAAGAGKLGYDSIALAFYWIAAGSELPEKEKMVGYEIQRVLYKPGDILKNQNNALSIINGIFWRLFVVWLWFLLNGWRLKDQKEKVSKAVLDAQPIPKISAPLWRRILIFPHKLYYNSHQLLASWYGTFDYYASMTIALANKGIELGPDIVHANDLDSLWAGYLIKKRTGAKLVYDAHEFWLDMGLKVPKPFILAFKLSEKYLLKKIDGFVTVNQPILEKVEKFYLYKFQIPTQVVYNCPNYEKVFFQSPNIKKIKILYQGRYAVNRGLEELAESARYLGENVEISFRAIHDPFIEEKLNKIIKEFKLEKKVKLLDPVPMQKMVQSAKSFDIGVIAYVPVHIDNELCTPNKLFEYMMAGLALTVSDLPVLKYIVSKYKNGIVFDPRDPKSIARALNNLISNPEKLAQMKKNSLEAAQDLNWGKEQGKLNNLYQSIIK